MRNLTFNQKNILHHYNGSRPNHREQGRQWYDKAHDISNQLSSKTGLDLVKTSAVLSALSPQSRWERNIVDTNILLNSHNDRDKGMPYNTKGMYATKSNISKAVEILRSDSREEIDLLFKNTHKTRNFYRNILNPVNFDCLTIDSHAMAIWYGRLPTYFELRKGFRNFAHYSKIANDYRVVADYLGISPIHLQAITWVAYRDYSLNIVDDKFLDNSILN